VTTAALKAVSRAALSVAWMVDQLAVSSVDVRVAKMADQ
jgi:hypothetical protein